MAGRQRTRPAMTPKPRTFYLVRHGLAGLRGPAWPDDTKRPLTPKGAARMRQVVRGLRRLDVTVELVLTSPLVRARQTAAVLVAGLEGRPALRVLAALSPGATPARLAKSLAEFTRPQALAIVGHEPDLGRFGAWLVGAVAPLPFKKGGVCRIDTPAALKKGAGQLIWLAAPRMLKDIR